MPGSKSLRQVWVSHVSLVFGFYTSLLCLSHHIVRNTQMPRQRNVRGRPAAPGVRDEQFRVQTACQLQWIPTPTRQQGAGQGRAPTSPINWKYLWDTRLQNYSQENIPTDMEFIWQLPTHFIISQMCDSCLWAVTVNISICLNIASILSRYVIDVGVWKGFFPPPCVMKQNKWKPQICIHAFHAGSEKRRHLCCAPITRSRGGVRSACPWPPGAARTCTQWGKT